jgi:hypothetical protein
VKVSLYRKQVELLLLVLPEVARESCFAIHGGTAINLFVQNMPRLSVDIDLTYIHTDDRVTALAAIDTALQSIIRGLRDRFPLIQIQYLKEEAKLNIVGNEAIIKVEVNLVKRGCFSAPVVMGLCAKARKEYGAFCEIQVVDEAHLYGGKICAALDRQHPRDLFDVRLILDSPGLSRDIMKGFIFYLISSNRSVFELLFPNFKDQQSVLSGQFAGMSSMPFSYEEFESTRSRLLELLHRNLTSEDRDFLVSLERGEPKWHLYDFKDFPAVRWKMQNIDQLRNQNSSKHEALWQRLHSSLFLD